jgi:hypothetical protein
VVLFYRPPDHVETCCTTEISVGFRTMMNNLHCDADQRSVWYSSSDDDVDVGKGLL